MGQASGSSRGVGQAGSITEDEGGAGVGRVRRRGAEGVRLRRLAALWVPMLVALALASAVPASAASPGAVKASLLLGEGLGAPLSGLGGGLLSASPDRGVGGRVRKSAPGISLTPSATMPHWACPEGACDAIVDPPARAIAPRRLKGGALARFALPAGGPLEGRPLEGEGEDGGYDPQNLQSAYKVPATGGSDQTVALVDAYGYPEAESNLAIYRERYGLSPCTKANGCFRKVDQSGREDDYPAANEGWETESALDIEMVSAVCPECHILLVEATSAERSALAESVNTAARLGATEISNSWGGPEQTCGEDLCSEDASDFDHPGILITAAGGDNGYDSVGLGAHSPEYPASRPDVVAVGGTSLRRAENGRGWSEEPWVGGGSGCSRFPKPEWQTDPACSGRMTDDVAADAACETPVSVYDIREWADICGTSVSTPMVAGIEAHASGFSRSLPGGEAFYEDPSALFDVTKGANGHCTPPHEDAYFCHAEVGYDGPTGNGTPDGPLNLSGAAPPIATSRPASAVGATGATLNGVVEPNGLPTTYRFEYGPTTSYGTSVPVPEGAVGTSGKVVSQSITGLSPDLAYHYRLVATSSAGTSYGQDVGFSTGAPSVTGVTPDTGVDGGGTTVTITGRNFIGASAVKFGSSEAESFTVESESSISAVSPAGTGPVQVTVSSPAGTSTGEAGDRFSYEKLGPVLAWGQNGGMLGNGRTESSATPVEVTGLGEATALATGLTANLAVLANGRVVGWGENSFHTVGAGTIGKQTVPIGVCAVGAVTECPHGPYLEEVTAVATGAVQSLALLKNGTVVGWGDNSGGAVGAGTEDTRLPVPVCMTIEAPCKPENYLKEVKAIAAGVLFSMALLDNGTVVAWGENYAGQLGDGGTTGPENCGSKEAEPCSRVPVAVGDLRGVTAIAAGWADGLALLEDGSVMAWGENELGELGDAGQTNSSVPSAVCAVGDTKHPCSKDLSGVVAIAGGNSDSFALLTDGTVDAWGANQYGQLGDDTPGGPTTCKVVVEAEGAGKKRIEKVPCSRTPVAVAHLKEVSAIASSAGALSTLARLHSGELVSWGAGRSLGDGASKASETPVGVCLAYTQAPCPNGPYLSGQVTAMAAGVSDLVSFPSSPGPVITSVTPDTGPSSGGTPVTIVGAGFTGASAVDFGPVEASEVQVLGPDEITAVSPPGSGAVDVTVITSEGVSPVSADDHFTYQGAPTVITGEATAVGAVAATLNATVNPDDEALGDCHFEYGTTPAYGSSVACSTLLAAGAGAVAVSAPVTALAAGATYYFRAVATNPSGTSYGQQQSFVTSVLPELGRCVKLPGKTGAYTGSSCTTPSAGEHGGRYEWLASPPAKSHFSASGGAATFEVAKGLKLECTSSLAGEYTGAHTASVALTLTGCKLEALGSVPCQSVGASAGEIKGEVVEAQLGMIEAGSRPTVAWVLNPYSQGPLATFECDAQPLSLAGSVIGSVTKVDKMSSAFTLTFTAGTHGVQSPERLEDGLQDTLIISGGEPTSLSASEAIGGEEAVEIKALG